MEKEIFINELGNKILIYNPDNRKVFNALFRIISAQKMFKHWRVVTHQR